MSYFAGKFDGDGYTISGLNRYIDIENNKKFHGFIRTLASVGVVKNVIFTGANIFDHEDDGAISTVIAYKNEGTVENCVVASSNIHHGGYDMFASGEVVYRLNGTVTYKIWSAGPTDGTQSWYQTLGKAEDETVDKYSALSNTHKTVYLYGGYYANVSYR